MKPFEKRLCEEYEQLTDRLVKLGDFIKSEGFQNLSDDDQADLLDQQQHMKGYHKALVRRIKRLEILP